MDVTNAIVSSLGMTRYPGDPQRFPATRQSAIRSILSDDPQLRAVGHRKIAEVYWRPVYTYARLRWRLDTSEAEDLTQEFFLRCFDLDTLAAYDPAKARFRTFLRVCLDRFATDQHRWRTRVKRGGGLLAFDFAAAELELARTGDAATEPELLFERAWMRHVMTLAVSRVRAELTARSKQQHLEIFELFHLRDDDSEPPSYAAVAAQLGISVVDVNNRLAYARRAFRAAAVAILREITADEDEFRAEMRALFGEDAADCKPTRGDDRD